MKRSSHCGIVSEQVHQWMDDTAFHMCWDVIFLSYRISLEAVLPVQILTTATVVQTFSNRKQLHILVDSTRVASRYRYIETGMQKFLYLQLVVAIHHLRLWLDIAHYIKTSLQNLSQNWTKRDYYHSSLSVNTNSSKRRRSMWCCQSIVLIYSNLR